MVPASPLAKRLAGFGTSIFAEMTALAVATDSVNLGQGFPDYVGPEAVLRAAVAEIEARHNQYPPGAGVPVLRAAVAAHLSRFRGLHYDPDGEVLVTMGATEAVAGALLGILDPGDEVVVFEPLFDTYAGCVALAGASLVPVPLRPGTDGRWTFDPDELRAAVGDRTRMILLNSPHNPTGTVMTRDELALIAGIALDRDLIVVSDEVYEHLVFAGSVHVPIASLPGMRERTVTVSSAGKTFSVTGWKIGWACAPAPLLHAVRMAKQLLTYAGGTPFQPAVATGLALPDEVFRGLARDLEAAHDFLASGLAGTGLAPLRSEGTYFLTVDVTPWRADGDGTAFCRQLPVSHGVAAIPLEALYVPEHAEFGRRYVRFAFCKRLDTLATAVERLGRPR